MKQFLLTMAGVFAGLLLFFVGLPILAISILAGQVHAPATPANTVLLLDLRKEQFNLRFQRATGQQEGTGRVRECRREIARVKTIQAEKTRSASKS